MGKILRLEMFYGAVLWNFCLGMPADAIEESSARAVGMGGTFVAVARNLDAVGWNPANLGLSSDRKVAIALFSLGVKVANSTFSLGDYQNYNGKVLSETDKQELLDRIPVEGIDFNSTIEFRAMGVSFGRYAFRLKTLGVGFGQLPKDSIELILFGNNPGRVYQVNDFNLKGQGVWSLSFSGAYPLETGVFDEFSLGLTFRLVNGIRFLEVINAKGMLTTNDQGLKIEGDALVKQAKGGNGFSIDFGAATNFNAFLSAGVSLINLGSITWDKEASENRGKVGGDYLKVTDILDVKQFSDLFDPVSQEQRLTSFSRSLPTLLRLGFAWKTDRILLAVDWEKGLTKLSRPLFRSRISAGGEYKMRFWLPIRGGLSFGGRDKRMFTFGFGLGSHRILFDFAVAIRKSILLNSATAVGMSSELKLGF